MSKLKHFAINAEDLDRARAFYQQVFGWGFEPWGPPDFFHIVTGDDAVQGALQKRRDIRGKRMPGLECTFSVDDVDHAAELVLEAGGKVIMPKATIEGVGELIFFEDSEGNVAGAMRYFDSA